MKLKIILEKSEEGGFTAYVPSLPGCISEGDSEEEAIKIFKKLLSYILNQQMMLGSLIKTKIL